MRVTVVGLGAVGGLLAAALVRAGVDVTGVARGRTLDAVRARGIELRDAQGTHHITLPVVADAVQAGIADLVVLALKSPALAASAADLAPLWRGGALVMPAMNGVPWWFLRAGPPPTQADLHTVDPRGAVAAALPWSQVLGCVVHLSSSSPAPGVVQHGHGQRLIVGEPAGGVSGRTQAVAQLLSQAGFNTETSTDIRREIWFKLWGNMTLNPVSALTGATADHILDDPLVHAFMVRAMTEAAAIGARIGCPIDQDPQARMAVTRELGAFKTSMLQDALAGRPLEVDALVTAVHEIGLRVGVATPNIDALLGLVRLMAVHRQGSVGA